MPVAPPGRRPVPLLLTPATAPLDAAVSVPGSKSITNRALPAAALADGTSVLSGIGEGDDVTAMVECLRSLGASIEVEHHHGDGKPTAVVRGCGGRFPGDRAAIDVAQSGTTARFLTAISAFGATTVRIDAHPQLRARPMGPLVAVLRQLGVTVTSDGDDGTLPYTIVPTTRSQGSDVGLPGGISSQFASGLLLSTPLHGDGRPECGLTLELAPPVVSAPYLTMTVGVMAAFGVHVDALDTGYFEAAGGQRYQACSLGIEPDASAASYPLAAAALVGGRVTVPGLGRASLQGDLGFVEVLADMGARVEIGEDATTVWGTGRLRGVDVDMADRSDTVPTLAVVAAFAEGPTRIRGVGFIRSKESDRIANVVRELHRLGIAARELDDGMVIEPAAGSGVGSTAPGSATVIETYDDHRMAMAFSLAGLRAPGVAIADPDCVAKTYPRYWDDLAHWSRRGRA